MSGESVNRAYLACTTLLSVLMLLSGAGDLLRVQAFVEDLRRLGYPQYLLTVLGIAKLLGVCALLCPGAPRLKEWAYAGFTFDLGGATISQLLSGPTVARVFPPMFCGLVLAGSYLAYRMRDEENVPEQRKRGPRMMRQPSNPRLERTGAQGAVSAAARRGAP